MRGSAKMDQIQLIKWFLLAITIFSMPLIFCQPDTNLITPAVMDSTKSYYNILRALRENWESPIMYLKKRGYIPKGSEPAFVARLSMKHQGTEDNEDKADDMSNVYEFDKNLHVREDMIESLANANKPLPQSILYTSNLAAPSAPTAAGAPSTPSAPSAPNAPGAHSAPVVASAKNPLPQSVLYTQLPKKGFLKNMKDKFLGLFGGKKNSAYNEAYLNDFDLQTLSNNKFSDYLKDFDKGPLNRKFHKERQEDKEDNISLNSKNGRSMQNYN